MIGEELLNEFYYWILTVRGSRNSTALFQKNLLKALGNYLQGTPLTYTSITQYISEKLACNVRHATINTYVDAVRVYIHFLKEKGYEYDIALTKLKKLKEQVFLKATMSDDEIVEFLKIEPLRKCDTQVHYMMTLFFSVCAYTGMRPQEVATLTPDRVDFGRGVFIVVEENSKTHDNRFLAIPPFLIPDLKKQINETSHYLFPSPRGGKTIGGGYEVVNRSMWGEHFHNRLKRLGIKRTNLTPYSLRHSFITTLLEQDVSLLKVKKIAGHKRITTTEKYTHLTTKDIIDAAMKHPAIMKGTDPVSIIQAIIQAIDKFELERDSRFNYEQILKAKELLFGAIREAS